MEATNLKTTELFTFDKYNQVIDVWGNERVKTPDYVIVIPYFKEKGQILMQYSDVPTFQLTYPQIEKWIGVGKKAITGTECSRTDVEACLKTEFGMTIEPEVEVEILAPLFIDPLMTTKVYICVLSLMQHEYELEQVENGKPVCLNCSELSNYVIYDIQTRYCIDLFKREYSLF